MKFKHKRQHRTLKSLEDDIEVTVDTDKYGNTFVGVGLGDRSEWEGNVAPHAVSKVIKKLKAKVLRKAPWFELV